MEAGQSGKRILVVDDEEDMLRAIEKVLTRRGYRVDTASDGFAAAEMVKEEPYDAVVSDMKMPGFSGIDLLKKVEPAQEDVLFIMITGYGTIETAVEAMRLGAFDYICKPFTFKKLIGTLEKGLHKRGREAAERVSLPEEAEIKNHEDYSAWSCERPDGIVLIGANDEVLNQAGEIVFCDLPLEGEELIKGEVCARTIDRTGLIVKMFHCPMSGQVVLVNEKMKHEPWTGQKDPYKSGWLFAIKPF